MTLLQGVFSNFKPNMKCIKVSGAIVFSIIGICLVLTYSVRTPIKTGYVLTNQNNILATTLHSLDNTRIEVRAPDGRITSLLNPENQYVVPNIVHYVWFGQNELFGFQHFLGVKSAFLFIKPEKVIFHCDFEPIGKWWRELKQLINSYSGKWTFDIVKREAPKAVHEREITRPQHKVDIAAIQILLEEGGIYLDLDVLVIKSFDPLRRYNFTMGLEYYGHPGRLNNGVILARKDTSFLKIWYNTYTDFVKSEWDEHSAQVPYELQFKYPELIHVEEKSINYPGGKIMQLIYKQKYDWSKNYAIHLWQELYDFEHNPVSITKMNTTFGEVACLIYYKNER